MEMEDLEFIINHNEETVVPIFQNIAIQSLPVET